MGRTIALGSFGNGIDTPFREFSIINGRISSEIGRTLFISLYSPDEGIFKGASNALFERKGVDTPIVRKVRQFMTTVSEALDNVNPSVLWLYMAHSRSGATAKGAIDGMGDDQKDLITKHLYFFGVAPASSISRKLVFEAANVFSEGDNVTKMFAKPFLNDPDYDIRILPCVSEPSEMHWLFGDHSFLGTTYREAWTSQIRILKEKVGFYDPFNN